MSSTSPAPQKGPDGADVFYSDLTKLWTDSTGTVQSFGTTYFSPNTPSQRLTAPQWIEEVIDFASRLTALWAKGLTVMTGEGYRLVSQARSGTGPAGGREGGVRA